MAKAAAAPTAVKAMSKAQLITALSEQTELPKKKVTEFIEALQAIAYKEAKKETGFMLPGFGKLIVRKSKARMGHNPKTGESMKIPAKKTLKFRVTKAAKDAVLGPPKPKK